MAGGPRGSAGSTVAQCGAAVVQVGIGALPGQDEGNLVAEDQRRDATRRRDGDRDVEQDGAHDEDEVAPATSME